MVRVRPAVCPDILRSILKLAIFVGACGQISFAANDNVTNAKEACLQLSEVGTLMAAFPSTYLVKSTFMKSVKHDALADSSQYNDDISHWALSSQQNASCSVEPSTPEDVSTIVSLSKI